MGEGRWGGLGRNRGEPFSGFIHVMGGVQHSEMLKEHSRSVGNSRLSITGHSYPAATLQFGEAGV